MTLLPQALSLTIPMACCCGILIGLRPAVGGPRVRRDAGLRRQPLPAAAPDCAPRASWRPRRPPTKRSSRCRTRTRPFARSRSTWWRRGAESNVKPRVFFEDSQPGDLRARLPPGGGWRDVFLADTTRPDQTTVYFAREGRLAIDRADASRAAACSTTAPGTRRMRQARGVRGRTFERPGARHWMPTPSSRGRRQGRQRDDIAELRADRRPTTPRTAAIDYSQRFMVQQKFSLPAACPSWR